MKYSNALILSIGLGLFGANAVQADEVLAQTGDTTAGAAFGAGTGMLVGGGLGGPIGALLGAGAGLLVGSSVQSASGLEERAYRVGSKTTGEEHIVRSPHAEFAIGQQVEVRGRRLHAISQ